MSGESAENSAPLGSGDREIKELMGLFDLPAFARRGQDLEYSLRRIHTRCREQREEFLEMVRVRLRQWSRVAAGPEDWQAGLRRTDRLPLAACPVRATGLGRPACPGPAAPDRGPRPEGQRGAVQ